MRLQFTICRTTLILALLVLPAVIAPRVSEAAAPWFVAPDGNDSAACSSAAAPCATIDGAIARALSGDIVYIAAGTYTGSGRSVVELDKSVDLLGGWDRGFTRQIGLTTVDGQHQRRGIWISLWVITRIERLRVTAGNAGQYGEGGGINNWGQDVTLQDCEVMNSHADYGGGGISHTAGILRLNNSTVTGNSADEDGGGINSSASLILTNSTVSGNRAGGTIYSGLGRGGGIYTTNAVFLYNSTVNDNWTLFFVAGGVDASQTSVPVQARNSIVAGNTASGARSDFYGAITSGGYNLFGYAGDFKQDYVPGPGDMIGVDAGLGSLQGSPGYHPLLPDSPAVNAGDPAGCTGDGSRPLPTDQRGSPRFGRCDIGAYELQPIGFSALKVNRSAASPGNPLTYTIALKNGGAGDLTNVRVTNALPVSLSYVDNSLTASGGTVGYQNGVITWSGTINAGGVVSIAYRATVNPTLGFLVNAAVITGGGETITRTAAVTVDGAICSVTKHAGNPVVRTGSPGSWDDEAVWRPAIVKEGSGYKMWYTGSDGSNPSRIGLATSNDGLSWQKTAANPVLAPTLADWEAGGIRAGSVISETGFYQMWYTALDGDGKSRIGYARSPDGVSWSKYGGEDADIVLDVGDPGSWEDDGVSGPTVTKKGGAYHMWYTGDDGLTLRIGRATSSNGIDWTKDPANPILDMGSPGAWDWLNVYGPSAVMVGANFKLWYSGNTLPAAWQTGYALASDGGALTRANMIIAKGPSGAFDAAGADYASVVVANGKYEVWYSGLNEGSDYTIGYAEAEICRGAGGPSGKPTYLPLLMKSPAPACSAYYTDSFGDSGSGWPVDDNGSQRYAYIDGQYQIWLKQPNGGAAATAGAKASDFTATFSARRTNRSQGAYGIHFGIDDDWSEFYEFTVEAEGYSIWRYGSGHWTALREWTAAGPVNSSTDWNRLKVVRSGASIAVYANNQLLITLSDSSFIGLRRIGLVAYSPGDAGLDVRFDDFSLYPASCGPVAAGAAGVGFAMGEPGVHEDLLPPGPGRLP